MKPIPKYILENTETHSTRKFKELKRKQLRAVKTALDELRLGVAATPGYHEIARIDLELEAAISKCNIKNWGR